MAVDFEDQNEEEIPLAKWPFFLSACFIAGLTFIFAYLQYAETGEIGTWQLLGCIFASALASILLFFPLFVEKALFLSFYGRKPKEEELQRKIFFDLKEIKGELDGLAVKIDKIPSVVDQILKNSSSIENSEEKITSSLVDSLGKIEQSLLDRLSSLESLIQSPILPDSDPKLDDLQKDLSSTKGKIEEFSDRFKKLQLAVDEIKSGLDKNNGDSESAPPFLPEQKDASTPEPALPEESKEELAEENELQEIINSEDDPNESHEEDTTDEETPVSNESKDDSTEAPTVQEDEVIPESQISEPDSGIEKEPIENELDLDLPDPKETIRKVDALLAGDELPVKRESKKRGFENPNQNEPTSVIANVMIGIGNKPFLRGEGPGLNWEEGVPMNFVEIGKWSWSPTKKNASLTVQVFRNDEDPDKSGKYEVKPGEKFEITPDF